MRQPKKHTCRWLDGCMDCCRHPSTYERFERSESIIYTEYKCRCRNGCGYERYDENHPMWWDASKMAEVKKVKVRGEGEEKVKVIGEGEQWNLNS